MKFGSREICNVVLRAKAKMTLGGRTFYKHEPVIYFDTLKTSSIEGASTTVYAQGGRGNPRLIAWEGERTMTFNMEDALLTPESFAILSGADLLDAAEANDGQGMFIHTTSQVRATGDNVLELPVEACWNGGRGAHKVDMTGDAAHYHAEADIFCMKLNGYGEITNEPCVPASVEYDNGKTIIHCIATEGVKKGDVVLVDYYVWRKAGGTQMEITPETFGGNFYLEAETLFRRERDGVDMPAEFVIPNCKIQSNFTLSMANSGDPSTFSFVIDAFPDYTKFDPTKKVMAAIQIVDDGSADDEEWRDNCDEDGNRNFKQAVTLGAGVTAKAVITGQTDSTCGITVSGTNVTSAYDTDTFGTDLPVEAVEIKVNMPVTDAGVYTVRQTNPALMIYDGKDEFVSNATGKWVKTKTYNLPANADFEYSFLVSEEPGDVTIELLFGGNVIKTYTIKNNVKFAN